MQLLKQSTAITLLMGPFVDSADGYTAETGLTPTVKVSKNGGALAARSSASAIAHDADGYYAVPLDATDTGTLGRLTVCVAGSATHLPVWHELMVLPASIFDSLVAGSDTLPADVTQWNGTNVATPDTVGYPKVTLKTGSGTGEILLGLGGVTVGSGGISSGAFASGAITATAIAADAIGASELAADAVAEIAAAVAAPSAAAIADAVCDEALSGHTTSGTVGGALQPTYWGDINFTVTDDESKDRYSVRWFNNGARLTSGITSPTITVTRRSDGTVLINAASLTDVGSGMLYYVASTTERQTLGHAYEVTISATIDAAPRTWTKNLSRDV